MENTVLSTRGQVRRFHNNNSRPNKKDYGPRLLDTQPRHNLLHIRRDDRLKIGRVYRFCKAGKHGVAYIYGKFLGVGDECGELGFEFLNSYVETFLWSRWGLVPYPEEENGRWENWKWIEAINIWQAIF